MLSLEETAFISHSCFKYVFAFKSAFQPSVLIQKGLLVFLRHLMLLLFAADFGVSAKNMKTLQKRDSFIGTPYW